MVAGSDHQFEPVEVRIGEQYENDTRIVSGLQEGQQVVASGQFLIDSEASLRGAEVHMGSGGDGGTP
jgi:Cu(I)/Ag(I) efflux system membrane fusion protein